MNKQLQFHSSGTVHVRSRQGSEGESRTIEGYAILFNTPSAPLWEDEDEVVREQIAPEAITKDLLDGCDIKMTMNHDVYNRWVRVCSFIRSFLDLQDKLHFNICRRRSLVAIGTHNLNAVKPPFYYKALPAEAVKFIPLNQKRGEGTLQYDIDERGVHFSFDAPNTDDGDRALELVRRGDIDGCSFMFSCSYRQPDVTSETTKNKETGKAETLYTIHAIRGIYDFTLTPMPAYPDTEVNARDLRGLTPTPQPDNAAALRVEEQVKAMRSAAKQSL